DVLEEVLAVAGDRQRADAHEPGGADLPEQLLGVLDGVSLRQGITTEEELPIGREDDRLGGGAAEVAAENGERLRAGRVSGGHAGSRRFARSLSVAGEERFQIPVPGHERPRALFCLLLVLSLLDPPAQAL